MKKAPLEFNHLEFDTPAALSEHLLARGEAMDRWGNSHPLVAAAEHGLSEAFDALVLKLVQQKRSGNFPKELFYEVVTQLCSVPRAHDWLLRLKRAKLRIARDPSVKRIGALEMAISLQKADVLALLIESGDSVHHRSSLGLTPLGLALNSSLSIVKLLVEAGAPLVQEGGNGSYSECLFSHVARPVNPECLRLVLARGALLRGKNPKGETPIQAAAMRGDASRFLALLEEGAVETVEEGKALATMIKGHPFTAVRESPMLSKLEEHLLDLSTHGAPARIRRI